jgi:hypothetical protein
MNATTLVVDALAVFRLTRLVTRDDFPPIKRAREAWWRRWPDDGQVLDDDLVRRDEMRTGPPNVGEQGVARLDGRDYNVVSTGQQWIAEEGHPLGILIGCPWCTSVYVGAGVVLARRIAPGLWDPFAKLLAFSAVAGIIAINLDSE